MQWHGKLQRLGLTLNAYTSISNTTFQHGTLVFTFPWRGLDLDALSWALTQLSGTTTPSIGLQSGAT